MWILRGKKHMITGAFNKRTVVFIGRYDQVGIDPGRVPDHIKKGMRLLVPVNNKRSVKYLVPAMLGIDL